MLNHFHLRSVSWLRTRQWRMFWRGAPALAACLGALALAQLIALGNAPLRNPSQRYKAMAVSALASTNYETARVACLRGLELGGSERVHSEWLYYLSRATDGLGGRGEAAELLNAAAPLDRLGSPLAHLAVARDLLSATNLLNDPVRLAERHLLIALMSEPQSVEANETLGRLYINTHEWEKAEKYLKQALPMKSEVALLLALAAQGRGDPYDANNWANAAVQAFTGNLRRDAPRENPNDRIGWAQALIVLKDFSAALSVLDEGYRQSGNPVYQRPIADLCAAWAGQTGEQAPSAVERLRLIGQGLQCAPHHPGLLKLVIEASHSSGPEGETNRATLSRLLAEGEPPPLLHFLLGNDAWQRGRLDEARSQMELAFKAAPQMPYVANNMAMLLTLAQPPDLDHALAIIQSVLDDYPQNADFRETRGEILLKLGRYKEAITDLEHALPFVKPAASTHKALAEAYQGIGMTQMAEEHLRLAKAPGDSATPGAAPVNR